MTEMHMQPSIEFLEGIIADDERQGRPLDYLNAIDGRAPTYEQAKAGLAALRAKGYEWVPCCDNVDETGKCKNGREA